MHEEKRRRRREEETKGSRLVKKETKKGDMDGRVIWTAGRYGRQGDMDGRAI